jgi:hypothetical protein
LIEDIVTHDNANWTASDVKNIIGFNEYARFTMLKYNWDLLDIDYVMSLRGLEDEDVDFLIDGILKSLRENGYHKGSNAKIGSVATRVAGWFMRRNML